MVALLLVVLAFLLLVSSASAQPGYRNADDYYLNESDDNSNNGFDTFFPSASVRMKEPSFVVNEQIRLDFVNDDPRSNDWVGIYPTNVQFENLGHPLLWTKVCGTQTCSGTFSEGSLVLGPSSIEADSSVNWPLDSAYYFAVGLRAGQPPYTHFAVSAPFEVNRASSLPGSIDEECTDSVTSQKSTYAYGEDIRVSFEVCNPEEGDWIGIFPSDIPEDELEDPSVWLYTCGTQSCHRRVLRKKSRLRMGSGRRLQIRQFMPLVPGGYRVYLLRDGMAPYQVLAKSGIFEIKAPVTFVATDKSCYARGDDIAVLFANEYPQSFDYVGFYPSDIDLGMVTDSIMWLNSCGNQFCSSPVSSGQLVFGAGGPKEGDEDTWPLNIGTYRVLLLRKAGGEPYEVLGAGNTFRVVGNSARCLSSRRS